MNFNSETKKNYINQKMIALMILKVIIGCIAVYLTLNCNKDSNIFVKYFYSLIAFVFAEIYILYYALYRVIMGNQCPA